MAPKLSLWQSEIVNLIPHIDDIELPKLMLQSLAKLVTFSNATFIINHFGTKPICIYDTYSDEDSRSWIKHYVNGTYLINPFYLAQERGLKLGAYLHCDLQPDSFIDSQSYWSSSKRDRSKHILESPSEKPGYITKGWPEGIEEFVIVIPMGESINAEIGLYSHIEDQTFTDKALIDLRNHLPIIAEITKKFWNLCNGTITDLPPDTRVNDLFKEFGKPILSNRESEVAQHVLRGYSSEAIGNILNIGIETVKTYRKRIYVKLNISSQSELFNWFLESAMFLDDKNNNHLDSRFL